MDLEFVNLNRAVVGAGRLGQGETSKALGCSLPGQMETSPFEGSILQRARVYWATFAALWLDRTCVSVGLELDDSNLVGPAFMRIHAGFTNDPTTHA